MELKVIEGNRDGLERKQPKAIWLGTPKAADYLIGQFQPNIIGSSIANCRGL